MMITDEQMIEALKTVRQYCKEHESCGECVFHNICEYVEYEYPMGWELKGDAIDE